ncbi:NADH-quinone oxidoreductase subunit D [Desulfurispirillum indicum]|uniref:NADH-quinone oxidoreductase subunit D n=1 Tax=Desulfurispirillum indicum (strain ATCC BAA-1389 / DSM 22839 / S5) TaxID=653733 RepID=E6W2P4_DESIS|nr:NADH-quinone oxidoreductase subunit D [Desulfurispirillum indicum]ADU65628.1 NADH dehydrogenase (quinone) [Desulfurispirillum indicum S5]UCZ57537.1 NADH-quinone oxidoreductase subunit D [Desulfurispirillum indicum]
MSQTIEQADMHSFLKTDLMYLNLGPSHPASHGTLRTLVAMDGESIVAGVSEIGYLHRGFEKSVEAGTWNQGIPYTDRLNYCSAIMNNVGLAKAIEGFMGIEITERCRYMRIILSELSRIIDHLVCNAANFVDMGALTNYWYLYNQREFVYDFLAKLTGARLTNSFTRVGGMYHDFYEGWEADLEDVVSKCEQGILDSMGLVKTNRIVHDRTMGVCAISAEDALSYGFTGPCLRSTGVAYDLRKDAPYYGYDEFDFDIPVGSHGDIYDRIMVRYEECFESMKIIRQAVKRIPGGPVNVEDGRFFLPKKSEVYDNIESLMNHFKLIFEGIKSPVGEMYDSTEAANGELGFYIVSDGGGRPYKIKVRPPCFYMMQAYPHMIEGGMVADAVINLGSLNIIAGELDR